MTRFRAGQLVGQRVAAVDQEFNPAWAMLEWANRQPEAIAIRDDASAYTYGQLAAATLLAAQHMRSHGAKRGTVVGVRCQDPLALLATVFGTALVGSHWVLAQPSDQQLLPPAPDLIFDDTIDPGDRLNGSFSIDDSWGRPPPGQAMMRPDAFEGYESPNDVWTIFHTSGTTGTPKALGLSHRTTTLRNRAIHTWAHTFGNRVSSLFPDGSAVSLTRYVAALTNGREIVASVDPDEWLGLNVDTVFGSPAQVRTVMKDRILPRRLPYLHLSGSGVPEKFVRHLLESFQMVAVGYGSTEAHSCISVLHTLTDDGTLDVRTEIHEGVIEIVDEKDQPLPTGTEGVVRVKNERLAEAYWENPQATAATFRDGYFYPGDIGRWTQEGHFKVTGRVNEQFNIGGVKINAGLLDYAVQNVPGVDDAVFFLMPQDDGSEALRAMIRLVQGYETDQVLADARVALLRVGGKDAVPSRFLLTQSVPRNANGKPDRQRCVAEVMKSRRERGDGVENA